MGMFKERTIIDTYPFTKKELVELRKSDGFKEGVDFLVEAKNNTKVILWTEGGLKKLLKTKGIDFVSEAKHEPAQSTQEPVKDATEKEVKPTDIIVPAIVRQKLPNRRLVACEIRGQWENVWVRDSAPLRPGHIINAVHRGGKWIGLFKVNNQGRVYAS